MIAVCRGRRRERTDKRCAKLALLRPCVHSNDDEIRLKEQPYIARCEITHLLQRLVPFYDGLLLLLVVLDRGFIFTRDKDLFVSYPRRTKQRKKHLFGPSLAPFDANKQSPYS